MKRTKKAAKRKKIKKNPLNYHFYYIKFGFMSAVDESIFGRYFNFQIHLFKPFIILYLNWRTLKIYDTNL